MIHESGLFSVQTANRGLVNSFNNQKATTELTHDMLNFRLIGTESYINFISYHILMTPSTSAAPVRRKKLLTMNKPKVTKHRISQKEKESKLVTKCLRRRLAWCNKTKTPYDLSTEQYSVFPRALADENGNPHKAAKNQWTNKIHSRYLSATPGVIFSSLPSGWIPQTVLIDAMFLLNTTPLRRTKNITEYCNLLFNRYLLDHYKVGVNEIHLLFDKPNKRSFNPKMFEQGRRDNSKSNSSHQHQDFTPTTSIPANWRQYIQCRECKRSIVEAIGLAFVKTIHQLLRNGQTLIIGGCFSGDQEETAWILSPDKGFIPHFSPRFKSNASETDFRIWRHAVNSEYTRVLIYSPDTDIYNIGLSLVNCTGKEYIVQLNVPHANEKKFIHLNNFLLALTADPDLATITKDKLAETLQVLFLCTGCDYNSYFKCIGKATFWNTFFQYSSFIDSPQLPGHLHETDCSSQSNGFLSFVRLVGTVYFKKHIAAFNSLYSYETSEQLFNSTNPTLSNEARHQNWLKKIREVVAERITTEEERVPSYTALWRHWLRTCWCTQLWQSSTQEDIYANMQPPEQFGWIHHSDGTYSIDWEDPDVQEKVRGTIDFLLKGCTCKKGCKTNRCKCRKRSNFCGPGCECQGCLNVPVQLPVAQSSNDTDSDENTSTTDSDENTSTTDSDDSEDSIQEEEEQLETEIITMDELLVFGQVDTDTEL